ncbi:hypothetical protein LTR70_008528 [Exophiala xenobiotica]|nr:hypothetical protein LTR70_008528 [Exophiala xenobiotica]
MIDRIYKRYRSVTIWADLDQKHYLQCYRLADGTLITLDRLRSAYRKFRPLVDIDDVQQAYDYDLGHTEMGKFLVKLVVHAMMNKCATYAAADQPGRRTTVGSTWETALIKACENNHDLAADIVAEVTQYQAHNMVQLGKVQPSAYFTTTATTVHVLFDRQMLGRVLHAEDSQ